MTMRIVITTQKTYIMKAIQKELVQRLSEKFDLHIF